MTPDDACAHPNWSMGRKISVDSATMMNKGLEVIEACWLFDTAPRSVEVVVHPQSVIHSMVEYEDGSVLAQLGNPDMRTPIAHALAWPERIESGVAPLDLVSTARASISRPPTSTGFRACGSGFEAAEAGGAAPAALNAANEVAVDAFLSGAPAVHRDRPGRGGDGLGMRGQTSPARSTTCSNWTARRGRAPAEYVTTASNRG